MEWSHHFGVLFPDRMGTAMTPDSPYDDVKEIGTEEINPACRTAKALEALVELFTEINITIKELKHKR